MYLPLSLLLFLIAHGKQLFVDSIGGEESSAANDCTKLSGHTDLASLHFDPGGYLSGGFVFDPGSSHSHGFLQSTSALSSGETIGHQHPLFRYCPSDITKCTAFIKAPKFISHVLFYSMHGEKGSDDLSVTASCAIMTGWINREMDAVQQVLSR